MLVILDKERMNTSFVLADRKLVEHSGRKQEARPQLLVEGRAYAMKVTQVK